MTMFVDNSLMHLHTHNCAYEGDPEYCTIIQYKDYTIKLFHEAVGVGFSDRYRYNTSIETFHLGKQCTSAISSMVLEKTPPITGYSDIIKIIEWIFKNA